MSFIAAARAWAVGRAGRVVASVVAALLLVLSVVTTTGVAAPDYDYDHAAPNVQTAPTSSSHAVPRMGTSTATERARQPASAGFAGFLAAKAVPDFIGPVRQSSSQIAHGHAFGKHVVKNGEFPEVSSPDDLARIVERVRTHGTHRRQLTNGREAFYDARDNTIVIRNPNSKDGGTVFRPDDGLDYFNGLK